MHKLFASLKGIESLIFEGYSGGTDHKDYVIGNSGTEGSYYNRGNGTGYDGTFLGFDGNGGSNKYSYFYKEEITNIFYFLEESNA